MSVAFYMDPHVKAAITDGLRRRGVDVMTCLADGTDREFARPIEFTLTRFTPTVLS